MVNDACPNVKPLLTRNITQLESLIEELDDEFSIESINNAANDARRLFVRLCDMEQILLRIDEQCSISLHHYVRRLAGITHSLNRITQEELAKQPQPNALMYNCANKIESCISRFISKRNQQSIDKMISLVPIVSDIAQYAQHIPYYWHYTNTQEKATIALSFTMTFSALAAGVATLCSPGIIGSTATVIPAVFTLLEYSKNIFNCVIDNSKNQHEQYEQTKSSHARLKQIDEMVHENFKHLIYPVAGEVESSTDTHIPQQETTVEDKKRVGSNSRLHTKYIKPQPLIYNLKTKISSKGNPCTNLDAARTIVSLNSRCAEELYRRHLKQSKTGSQLSRF